MTDRRRSPRLSRRQTLRLLGGAGATALLAACGYHPASHDATRAVRDHNG